jgi:2-polyprenyl-3-methyl-5-hydroxy-6-metoxy-1,4-benzoquinol methylase
MSVARKITELSVERATPEEMAGRLMESEHRARYAWAGQLAEGREVLDAGCGSGYGTEILAAAGAQRVVGIDVSDDAIEHARSSFAAASTEFRQADLHQLPFEDGSFDLVVCFEVIEHVDEQQQAISELRRVLRSEGFLAISSPNRDVYPAGNPHHTHEFVPDELARVLATNFADVKLYRQSPWLAAAILDDQQSRAVGDEAELRLRAVKIASVEPGNEVFTVALASNAELPEPEALLQMGEPFEVRWWETRLNSAIHERDYARAERERQRNEQGRVLLEVEKKLASTQNEVAELRATEADLKKWAKERVSEAEELLQETEREHQRDLRECEQARGDFENRLRRAEGTIGDITGSLSWRMTAPLRAVKRLFSG